MRFWPSGFAPQFCHLLKGVMVPAKSQTQMARKSKETRGKVICTRLFLKTDSAPSPRTCPKEASGNSTEPASLGVKQSAADAGICRDRTAIQTAGAVSGGPCSDTWREQRCARVPSRPPPVAMAAPTPPRRASPSFPVSRSLESRVCHVQEGRVGPRRGGIRLWLAAALWLRPRLRRRHILGRVRPPEESLLGPGCPHASQAHVALLGRRAAARGCRAHVRHWPLLLAPDTCST